MNILGVTFLLLFGSLIVVLLFSGGKKLILKIKSLGSGEIYTAERKNKTNGTDFLDWVYLEEGGNEIEDEDLKKMIFESFSDEDWYGDYEFQTSGGSLKPEVVKTKKV